MQRIAAALARLAGVCLLAATSAFAQAPAATEQPVRLMLSGHVLPALAKATPLGQREHADKSDAELTLTLVLRRHDTAGFARYLQDVYDVASPQYRHFLTPEELADRFGPSAEDYASVRAYFERQGFAVTATSANRLTLSVSGDRARVESALDVHIGDYRIGTKRFHANDRDPSLPVEVAKRVEAVSGLSDLGAPRPNHQTLKNVCLETKEQATSINFPVEAGGALIELLFFEATFLELILGKLEWIGALGFVCFPGMVGEYVGTMLDHGNPRSTVLGNFSHLEEKSRLAAGIAKASALTTATGLGQKIGLMEFDTFNPTDVSNFIALTSPITNTPPSMANLSTVHVSGGATLGPGESEVLLDIDTVMAVAPKAQVVVYDAPLSASYQAVFNAMINGGVSVISNSWASCEDEMSAADVQSIDSVLASASASGISVFNGSGDNGSTCLDGAANTIAVPADSPSATAVGGSSRVWSSGFVTGSETWWDGSAASPPSGQGGFGVSRYFSRPGYQTGFTSASARSVPDVVDNADPRTGMPVCQADAGGCPTGALLGGTSMSTPAWAGYAALMNEAAGQRLGAFNPILYPLASTRAFNNAASMGSDFAHVGLGSPNPAYLKQQLLHQATGSPSATESWVVPLLPVAVLRQGDTAAPADGVSRAGVRVTLWDANGNLVAGKTIALTASPGSHATITPVNAVTSAAEGSAIFDVTDLVPESITFTATDATDNVVLHETATLTFVVPPATAGGIVAAPGSVPADGATSATVTITLEDALNRPTPGKRVVISQGSGHSVITGPSPAVTDANGRIQFTVTDTVSETVVYNATDATDGDLPIPGSASVTFTSGSASCLPAPPTAAPGFTLSPFANGFVAQNFFFANINFVGCPGVSNPAFDSSGSMLVADFPTGDLYKLPPSGGAASSANKLSNLGRTFGNVVFGKDGSLYGSTFSPAAIVQVDPNTGAIVRTVASGFSCPSGLAIDPLSGDLFFDDNCVGGIQNASIWRVQNPSSASPTTVVYATLPGFGNGQLAFSPDGTLYAVTEVFNNAAAPVVQISGTDKPAPHTPVTVSGITTDTGGLAIGQVLANGAAKSLIVHNGGQSGGAGGSLKLVELTTLNATVLANGLVEPGVIGPDGCMYVNSHDTILRLAPTGAACSFTPTNPGPSLALSPSTVTPAPAQGTTLTFTAAFSNVSVPAGTIVHFGVSGANATTKIAPTNGSGTATMSYTGAFTGTDTVVATAKVGSTSFASNSVVVTWSAGKHVTSLTLNLSPSGGIAGRPVTVVASLTDVSATPMAAIAGATIQFTLGAQHCNGVTDAHGVARCTFFLPATKAVASNSPSLVASFAGTTQYAPAQDAELFQIAAAAAGVPGAPTIGAVTPGPGQAMIIFAPPASDGGSPITAYLAACTPVGGGPTLTATGPASPIFVLGLTSGVTFGCTVSATNANGTGAASPAAIVAIGGPSLQAAKIPTLSTWTLALLGISLLLLGGTALQRRRS